ncbi:hypothetical protein [Streptomyces mirabilis]|uniref:hypothetical protein n=1 Tax=Streptomyces mirabilis TaxID=68239 RepID=UPI0033214CEB
MAYPQVLKAVTDAEKYLLGEAKSQAKEEAKQRATEAKQKHADAESGRLEGLAIESAEQLRSGIAWHLVTRWLKNEHGVGFIDRGNIMSRANKIAKGKV